MPNGNQPIAPQRRVNAYGSFAQTSAEALLSSDPLLSRGSRRSNSKKSLPIDLFSVTDSQKKDEKNRVADLVDDPVVTDPDSKAVLRAFEFLAPGRPGIFRESIDLGSEPVADGFVELPEVA